MRKVGAFSGGWMDVLSGPFLVEGWNIQSISAKAEAIPLEKDKAWTVFRCWSTGQAFTACKKTEIQHLTQLEAVLENCFQSKAT